MLLHNCRPLKAEAVKNAALWLPYSHFGLRHLASQSPLHYLAPMADEANAAPAGAVQGPGFLERVFQFVLVYLFVTGLLKPLTSPPSKTPPDLTFDPDVEATLTPPVFKDSSPLMSLIGADSSKVPVFPSHDSLGRPLPAHSCLYSKTTAFDLAIYISDKEALDSNDRDLTPVLHQTDIAFDWRGDSSNTFEVSLNITLSESLQRNQSALYAHAYFTLSDSSVSLPPFHPEYDPLHVFSKRIPLIVFKKKPKKKNTKLLLERSQSNDSASTDEDEGSTEDVYLPYWRPSLVVSLVLGMPDTFARNAIPHSIIKHFHFVNNNGTHFYPLIYHDDFWVLTKHLIAINETISSVPLHVKYSHIPFWKWSLQTNMEAQNQANIQLGASSDHENDALKEIFTDTNPWLLGVTVVVSLLHMIFDMLAFKNDIQFWRKVPELLGSH